MAKEEAQTEWLVIDLGGSVIAPSGETGLVPDHVYTVKILAFLHKWLLAKPQRHLGLIIGGGAPSRRYLDAARKGREDLTAAGLQASVWSVDDLDVLGIAATHFNGEYVRLLCASLCDEEGTSLVRQPLLRSYDDLAPVEELGRIVVGGGWKPGFSTDYDAVLLAEHCACERIYCLSNIAQICDSDPKTNPEARACEKLSWAEYEQIAGSKWVPGTSLPFDPVATAYAAKIGMELVFADGRDLENFERILNEEKFLGTVVR
ncbi:UMP kinase [Candidatus Haliotispira prima]|uniref:UMP kinase n=1 Tax=Candidatus Haliotispira prima TaxID=3034016 RepID=A0ABY8MH91_9SPIO|nr:UMP kinase [Candidatus Haliotispira prima]